ncbi:MAG TPA: low temperature requirement protein A [Nocardioidaceae bacterium]|nr:low temperature requirement protein A [Nocardioidaceae bacterium]
MSEAAGASEPTVVPDIRYIRPRGREQRATFFELFFDLVYVFAVTQLSHHLLGAGLTWTAAAQTALMLIAVYWAWNYTTWMANWFDPETTAVRLILIVVMLASLLMAVAIPEGFGARALLFAASYVGLQVARNAFVVVVTPPGPFNQNFRQILAWSLLSAPLWIAGGIIDDARWPLWLAALGVDLAGPLVRFWLPRLGSTPHRLWEIDGNHFAERFELFVIIALGESIVLTGVTASNTGLSASVTVALGLAFISSTALWWLYFSGTARILVERISGSRVDEIGALGRDVFTYLHLPIIAGIVLMAVGDELVIAHPNEALEMSGALTMLCGPALYLVGLVGCLIRVGHEMPWPTVATVVVLLAAIPLATLVNGMVTLGFVVVVLVALAIVDERRRATAR